MSTANASASWSGWKKSLKKKPLRRRLLPLEADEQPEEQREAEGQERVEVVHDLGSAYDEGGECQGLCARGLRSVSQASALERSSLPGRCGSSGRVSWVSFSMASLAKKRTSG